MPRARIPYGELQYEVEQKYPFPLYRNVELLRKDRYNGIPAPTVVYDRSTGNYKRIGWKVQIQFEQFAGIREQAFYGYRTDYKRRVIEDVIFMG
jgi:hypothetical protein